MRIAAGAVLGPLLLFLLLAPQAAALSIEPPRLVAHDDGERFWFTYEGGDQTNPRLVLPAGATVNVTLTNAGSFHHAFLFGPTGEETRSVAPNGTASVLVTVPSEEGVYAYVCPFFEAYGMRGEVEAWTGRPKIQDMPLGVLAAALAVAAATVGVVVWAMRGLDR